MADRIVVMNRGRVEQVGSAGGDLRPPGDRVRRRLRRRHEHARRRRRGPGRVRVGPLELACNGLGERAAGPARQRSGCGPRKCASAASSRARQTPFPSRVELLDFLGAVLPRDAAAGRRCRRSRDPVRLLRQPHARPRHPRGPGAHRRAAAGVAARVRRRRGGRRMSLAAAALPVRAPARRPRRSSCARRSSRSWLPAARHRAAARDAAVEELPERRRALRRPRQLRPLLLDADAVRLALEQLLGRGAVDRHRRAARLRLCLCAHPQRMRGQAGCSTRSRCCRCSRPRCSRPSRSSTCSATRACSRAG